MIRYLTMDEVLELHRETSRDLPLSDHHGPSESGTI
jgi:hypothetical protein